MRVVFSSKNFQLAVHPQFEVLKMSGTTGHIVAKTCNMSTRYHKPPVAGVHQYTLINVQLTASATSREGKVWPPSAARPHCTVYLLYKETDFLCPKYFKLSRTKTLAKFQARNFSNGRPLGRGPPPPPQKKTRYATGRW
jgi:hypothetical protein